MNKIKKYFSKKNIIFVSLLICCLTISFSFCYSYFTSKGTFVASAYHKIIWFNPVVNSSFDRSQSINLASTITNNKTLAPGAEGKFKIDVHLGYIDLDTYYKLSYDRTSVPENLHFYVDEEYKSELTTIEGIQYQDYHDNLEPFEHFIYWKWDYVDSEEANANDNLYMGKDITVTFNVDVSQHIENRTIIANNREKQVNKMLIVGNNKSLSVKLNFQNLNPTNYRIHFEKSDEISNVHFYSDSSYRNEIKSVSGYYDGTNDEVTRTIYWKTDDDRRITGVVYYTVYLY